YRLTHDMWNSGNRIWLTTIISNSVKHSDVVEKTKLIFDKKYQFKGQITDLRNENLRQLVLKSANTRKLVQIRRAETLNDINLLFPLGKIASEEPSFNLSNFDLNKRKKVYEEWLENKKKYVILIAEQEGEAIGFLTAWAGRHYLSKTDVAATVTAFFVLPEKRGGFAALKLIDGFRQWAKNRDAKSIHIHVTSGIRIRETDRFLRKIGFRSMGGNYAKDL
ncbi:MAG: GNAT family N-acetyltransferase, partial [Sneathiella sp.]